MDEFYSRSEINNHVSHFLLKKKSSPDLCFLPLVVLKPMSQSLLKKKSSPDGIESPWSAFSCA